jgi:uncharacterized protein (UPF0210 family)
LVDRVHALPVVRIATVCGAGLAIIAVLRGTHALTIGALIVHRAQIPIIARGAVLFIRMDTLPASVTDIVGALVPIVGTRGAVGLVREQSLGLGGETGLAFVLGIGLVGAIARPVNQTAILVDRVHALPVVRIATVCGAGLAIIAVLRGTHALTIGALIVHRAQIPIIARGAVLFIRMDTLPASVTDIVGALVPIVGAHGAARSELAGGGAAGAPVTLFAWFDNAVAAHGSGRGIADRNFYSVQDPSARARAGINSHPEIGRINIVRRPGRPPQVCTATLGYE